MEPIVIKLDRPVVFFDIEATGANPATDRIVTLFAAKFSKQLSAYQPCDQHPLSIKCNPGVAMSQEVIGVHGITNEEVADLRPFKFFSQEIHDFMLGCDLAGFNCTGFDTPILWEEFYRCGITWNLDGVRQLDAGVIFKQKERRTLAAAVRFYTGCDHEDAHDASADVLATVDVLMGQLHRYKDDVELPLRTVDEIAAASKQEDRVDLAGIIVRNKDGVPVFNTKRNKGVPVKDDIGYAEWFLRTDFSANTKIAIEKILSEP